MTEPATQPIAQPAIRVTAMPKDANSNGDIFGGWLMSLMDMGGGLVAARHAKGRVATVAVTGMQFLAPVQVGDEVSVYGEITRIGRTSMTIAIEAWQRDRNGEITVKVTEAQFTFVAIDDAGRPRPLDQGQTHQEGSASG